MQPLATSPIGRITITDSITMEIEEKSKVKRKRASKKDKKFDELDDIPTEAIVHEDIEDPDATDEDIYDTRQDKTPLHQKNIIKASKMEFVTISDDEDELKVRLNRLRKKLANKNNVHPDRIFSEDLLTELVRNKPTNKVDVDEILGETASKYGEEVLSEIMKFVEEW